MTAEFPPEENQNDVLEQAVIGLRDTPVSDGPSRQLIADVVFLLEAEEVSEDSIHQQSRSWTMIKRTSFAATAVLIATFAFVFFIGSDKAVVLADVLENVKKAQTLSFQAKVSQPDPKGSEKLLVMTVERSIKGKFMRTKDSKGGIRVIDMNKGITLSLRPADKRATIIQGKPQKKKQPIDEVVELLKGLRKESKKLGTKVVEKKKSTGFLALKKGPDGKQWEIEVWVDEKTGLPVRIEERMGERQAVFEKFEWNKEMDDALFSLTPPTGYKVTTATVPQ